MVNVEKQQLLLAYLGYYQLRYAQEPRKGDLAIDRIPGPSLTGAIRSFQRDNSLQQDGLWGPQTQAAVLQAVQEGRFRPAPEPPYNPKDIPGAVFAYLLDKGFSPEAAAGIMGNIDAESAMQPTNMEDKYQTAELNDLTYTAGVDDGSYTNFIGDHVGYGLCQWTWWSRKAGLLSMAKDRGVSIGSLQLQLDWLWHELSTQYTDMVRRLKAPGITVQAATEDFMRHFEDPFDKSDAAIQRRVKISLIYYKRYA